MADLSVSPEAAGTPLRSRLYGAWLWVVTVVLGVVVWPLVQVLPGRTARWRLVRLAGGVLRLAGAVPLVVRGKAPGDGPCVVVANHSSYLDGLVLISALARPVTFAVGGPLASQRIAGPFLRALGCTFVGQSTRRGARAQLDELTAVLGKGERLVMFPEGSLGPTRGMRKFHIGAFLAAAEARCPVVPVAIDGSRALLAPSRRMPRRSRITVAFGTPLDANGDSWSAAHELARRSREAITALLDLAGPS